MYSEDFTDEVFQIVEKEINVILLNYYYYIKKEVLKWYQNLIGMIEKKLNKTDYRPL